MTQTTPDTQAQIIAGTVTWLWDTFGGPWSRKIKDRAVDEVKWRWSISKYYTSLHERVGFVRILGRMEAEPLENVFTHVNLLDRPSAERRYDIARLMEEFGPRDFSRHARIDRVPGEDALAEYPKMFILGKPGAGKTTFLKHTALRAINGEIKKVPIFVSLKELSYSGLDIVPFIAHQFDVHRFPNPEPFVEDLLKDGKALVLFDGLDEVNLADDQRATMIHLLNDFVYQYGDCPIVITCRVAATDYSFTQFEYVEMADFDEEQIGRYIDHWFAENETKRLGCREALLEGKEIVGVRELAQVPLLLALLCLVYEERNEIPPELHEIYEEAARALLSKWDASRNIVRDSVYQGLTLNRKQGLLAQLAARSFDDGVYFMKEQNVAQQIEQYLVGVSGLEEPDGELVLQSMEAQHGILVERARNIHSFSHLTMQEYFTARYIVANESRGAVDGLMEHVLDDRWREVFLLVAGMLSDATAFCEGCLEAARELISEDSYLVGLLSWAADKGEHFDVVYRPAAVRAFLLSSAIAHDQARYKDHHGFARNLAIKLDNNLDRPIALVFVSELARGSELISVRNLDLVRASCVDLDNLDDYTINLAEGLLAHNLVADLRALGAPPKLETEADLEPWASWVERFSVLLKPYRDSWDPDRQMPVSKEEAELFLRLNTGQINRWRAYLRANWNLQRYMQIAYVPDRAAIEDRMLLTPS